MRLAAGVEYDGTPFHGWQRQRQRQSPTVQECIETALSRVADHPVDVFCAGRTDAGVHGRCQVIHFDSRAERSERAWVLGANTHLHPAISLLWVRPVPESFHARFAAARRRYRYLILNRWVRPALDRQRVAWVRHPLDAARMHAAAQALLGEHDFSSFRARHCQAKSPVKTVHEISVQRHGSEVRIDIEASAFVYHMVRNIAGSLIAVGQGKRAPEWIASVLAARDRTAAGITAPADGLTFMHPSYPDYPQLPVRDTVSFPLPGLSVDGNESS
jgi:tRNA pseudouridine38-40 synthase